MKFYCPQPPHCVTATTAAAGLADVSDIFVKKTLNEIITFALFLVVPPINFIGCKLCFSAFQTPEPDKTEYSEQISVD